MDQSDPLDMATVIPLTRPSPTTPARQGFAFFDVISVSIIGCVAKFSSSTTLSLATIFVATDSVPLPLPSWAICI